MLLYKLYNNTPLKMKDGVTISKEEINEQYPFTTQNLGCYGYTNLGSDELVFTIENVADIKVRYNIKATEPQAILDEYMAKLKEQEDQAYKVAMQNSKTYDLLLKIQADTAYNTMLAESQVMGVN